MDEQSKPPHNLVSLTSEAFWEKLDQIHDDIRERFFGYTYKILSTKTLRRDDSNETLVEALCCYEEWYEKNKDSIYFECDSACHFLRLVLERNAPLFGYEEEVFGPLNIKRDRSGLSEPQKKEIAFQAGAQVLWYLKKSKIPTIQEMQELLLNKTHPFFEILAAGDPNLSFGSRTVSNWISKVFPIPQDARRGRPSKVAISPTAFECLVCIPGIFSERGAVINFSILQFVLTSISRFLEKLEWTREQIINSEIFKLYANPVHPFLRIYNAVWVHQVFLKNSSIFTP